MIDVDTTSSSIDSCKATPVIERYIILICLRWVKKVSFRVLGSRHPSIGDSSHKQSHHAIKSLYLVPTSHEPDLLPGRLNPFLHKINQYKMFGSFRVIDNR